MVTYNYKGKNENVVMHAELKCQGFGYMNALLGLFKQGGSVGVLPERTMATLDTTYEMGFDLKIKDKLYPLTFIDIAGEVFCDIYRLYANGENTITITVRDVLDTVERILIGEQSTDNRKIHFFVIEYSDIDKEYKGIPQITYLRTTAKYIKDKGIFNKATDAIFILITKSDKINANNNEDFERELENYIREKYQGFYDVLRDICSDNEIGDKKVHLQPFTLGEVCFQHYCKFDPAPSSLVVQQILDRCYSKNTSKRGRLINIFRN